MRHDLEDALERGLGAELVCDHMIADEKRALAEDRKRRRRLQQRVQIGPADHGEIERFVVQEFGEEAMAALFEVELHARMGGGEIGDDRSGKAGHKAAQGGDRDPAAFDGAQRIFAFQHGGENTPGVGQEAHAAFGQHDGAPALQQRAAERILQHAHAHGNGRLRHVETGRGLGETAVANDAIERTKLIDVHQPILWRWLYGSIKSAVNSIPL